MSSPAVTREEVDKPRSEASTAADSNSGLPAVDDTPSGTVSNPGLLAVEATLGGKCSNCVHESVGHELKHETVDDMGLDEVMLRGDARVDGPRAPIVKSQMNKGEREIARQTPSFTVPKRVHF